MNLCSDCRWLERGYSLDDHICARPTGARRLAARERYSMHANACTQLGKFFQSVEDRGLGRREFGDDR